MLNLLKYIQKSWIHRFIGPYNNTYPQQENFTLVINTPTIDFNYGGIGIGHLYRLPLMILTFTFTSHQILSDHYDNLCTRRRNASANKIYRTSSNCFSTTYSGLHRRTVRVHERLHTRKLP